MYVIDGIFFTRRMTGIQRFAMNIVKELDEIAPKGMLQMLVPEGCEVPFGFKSIEVVKYGKRKGYIWEQTDLARYLKEHKAQGIFLENAVPFFYRKGIVVLHDISLKVNPRFFSGSLKMLVTRMIWTAIYRSIVRSDMRIVTVSEFSKSEIMRVYRVRPHRITVIGNAWQHMNEICEDENILEKVGVKAGEYFFSLASGADSKNFKWVIKAAEQHPTDRFVVAGKIAGKPDLGKLTDNVILTGYISDEEAKALMKSCRAFLFPSFYEGFGIPPMEALASGASALVLSDIPCLREIYGDIAGYVDPHKYENIEIPLIPVSGVERERFLLKYSWKESARKLFEML